MSADALGPGEVCEECEYDAVSCKCCAHCDQCCEDCECECCGSLKYDHD